MSVEILEILNVVEFLQKGCAVIRNQHSGTIRLTDNAIVDVIDGS